MFSVNLLNILRTHFVRRSLDGCFCIVNFAQSTWTIFSLVLFNLDFEQNNSTSPYSARMRENADQNNSEYGHFSRSGKYPNFLKCYNHQVVYPIFLGKGKKYSPSRNISILPKIWKIVKFVSSCNHCHYSV